MSLSGYCVNILLVLGPVFFCVVVSRFSFHQVPGFSGRRLVRTVSTSPLFVSPCCPLVPEIDFVVSPYSFVARSSLSLLPLCFGVSCPFPVSRLTVSPVLSLLAFPLFPASDSSGRRLVRVVRALAPPVSLFPSFLLLASPSGVVPGLSGRRLVRISSATLISLLLSFTSLIPDLLSRRDLRLSVIFLAADWSGVSHCWLSSQTIPSSKPGTFSGRRLVRGVAAHHILMVLLTRQQAKQSWSEPDPNAQFDDLLEALGLYKDISTEYGLNQTVHHQWRFGDPHKKTGEPDRHDYEIKIVNGIEVAPGPNWHSLYRWVVSQAAEFLAFQTVYLVTDNRDLLADTVANTPGLGHWPMVAAWWKERIQYVGPYGERTTVVFVPISADTGLDRVHGLAPTYLMHVSFSSRPSILPLSTAIVFL